MNESVKDQLVRHVGKQKAGSSSAQVQTFSIYAIHSCKIEFVLILDLLPNDKFRAGTTNSDPVRVCQANKLQAV